MEQWKDIPDFDGIYEASTEGRIRSKEGKTTVSSIHGICHWQQRIIKQHWIRRKNGKSGDAKVTLWKEGKPHYFLVSRLIALTWCDGYTEGATVNHKDGDPTNNAAENLEWLSLRENILHGFENGLYPTQKKCTLVKGDGTQTSFRSQSQASLWLGRCVNYVWECVQKNKDATSVDGETYKIVTY